MKEHLIDSFCVSHGKHITVKPVLKGHLCEQRKSGLLRHVYDVTS
jgi:hypothetical protein